MHVFFDLDGTLTDSSPCIVRCINFALAELGRRTEAEDRIRAMIGAPLAAIFCELLHVPDTSELDRAVERYRARFNTVGIFENEPYPGVAEGLRTLRCSGHTLQVVTAKPADAARRVLAHLAVGEFFDAVHGPAVSDTTCDKADLVHAALTMAGGDPHRTVMVGDRAADVAAARIHGVRAVAVTWGFGSREELAGAGPDYLAESFADLVRWLCSRGPKGRHEERPESSDSS